MCKRGEIGGVRGCVWENRKVNTYALVIVPPEQVLKGTPSNLLEKNKRFIVSVFQVFKNKIVEKGGSVEENHYFCTLKQRLA